MFKKLKQRIEENDAPSKSSTKRPMKPRGSPYGSNDGKLRIENKWDKKYTSSVSLYSSRESINSNVTMSRTSPASIISSPGTTPADGSSLISELNTGFSKEEIITELGKRSAHIKKLEIKITEMAAALTEQATQKGNLEDALQTMRHEIKNHVEATDRKCQLKVSEAKDELEKNMRQKDMEFADIIRRKDEEITRHRRELYLENSRNVDVHDLTKLQQDEIGKMKQMLIHSQAEMTKKAAELFEKSKHLENLDKEYVDQKLVLEDFQNRLDGLARERSKYEMREKQLMLKINTLEKERDAFKSQMNEAVYDLSEKSGLLEISQTSLQRAQEDATSLRETYKLFKIKTIDEKERCVAENDQLRERVADLEQRLKDGNLSTTGQATAFEKERELNESRLQEARSQLAENKARSSEKISTLGSLVSSLDEQLKEKTKQFMEYKENTDIQIADYQKKMESFEEQIQSMARIKLKDKQADVDTIVSLQGKIDHIGKRLAGVKEDNSDLQAVAERAGFLEAQNKLLDSRLRESNKKIDDEKTRSDGRIRELQKEIQLMSYQFEHSNKINVETLESKIEEQERRIFQYQKTIEDLIEDKEKLNATLSINETSCKQTDKDKEVLLEKAEQQTKELEIKMQLLESRLWEKEEEMQQIKAKESKTRELIVENKALLAELDNANKKLKTQQQKFLELKKACQKDLSVNAEQLCDEQAITQTNRKLKKSSPTKKEVDSPAVVVNFTYLKHVILKYMCSTNDQSRQLIGVISHLLQFTPREEIIVKECLEWKLPIEKR